MKNHLSIPFIASCLVSVSALAASPVSEIRAFRTSHQQEILTQYV